MSGSDQWYSGPSLVAAAAALLIGRAGEGPCLWDGIGGERRALIERALGADFAEYMAAFDPTIDAADSRLGALWLEWCAAEALRRYGEPAELQDGTSRAVATVPDSLFAMGENADPAGREMAADGVFKKPAR